MRKLLLPFLSIICLSGSAQVISDNRNVLLNTFLPIAGGMPVNNTKYVELTSGTPFFQEEWAKAKLISLERAVYIDVPVKIDLLENNVRYKDSTGKELLVGISVREILFQQASTGKSIHFISGSILPVQKKGLLQLLVNDSVSLLKAFVKTFEQHTSYGSATEYSIKTVENYYAYYNGKEYEIKKPSDFIDIFPAMKTEIENHLKTVNKKLSREEQFIAIAGFLNLKIKR
jgi:hypothetical protein